MLMTAMQKNRFIYLGSIKQQNGAVLLVSLFFLIILATIGIVTMGNSLLQERMSANAKISEMAFQAADSGVRGYSNWFMKQNETARANEVIALNSDPDDLDLPTDTYLTSNACVQATGALTVPTAGTEITVSTCTEYMDGTAGNSVKSTVQARVIPCTPCFNYSINSGGGPNLGNCLNMAVVGTGSVGGDASTTVESTYELTNSGNICPSS